MPLLLWSARSDDAVAGHTGPTPRPIPLQFWAYWHDATLPLVVQACLASWRARHPDARITMLHPESLPPDMPTLPPGFDRWSVQVQSDWIRLAILARFGGIWMDASTLLHAPLQFVDRIAARHAPDLIGYFNRERTHDAVFPMLENWFLAAPEGSAFVQRWWRCFDGALSGTGTPDGAVDIDVIARGLPLAQLLQGFCHAPDYFACHAAAQRVMRDAVDGTACAPSAPNIADPAVSGIGPLALMPAERDAFLEPHTRQWDPDRVCNWLCDASARPAQARLTKLIGLLWRPLEARLQRGDVDSASIVGRLLR